MRASYTHHTPTCSQIHPRKTPHKPTLKVEIRCTIFPPNYSTGKSYDAACAPLHTVVLLAFEGCVVCVLVCVYILWCMSVSLSGRLRPTQSTTTPKPPTQSKTFKHPRTTTTQTPNPNTRLKPGETFSLPALAERTRLPVADLKPLLHSLACVKYKACTCVCVG